MASLRGVRDAEWVAFLQWALPQLGLRWAGFRKVRRQVCRRIAGRMAQLGVTDLGGYRARLDEDPGEWAVLDALCFATISRFFRDRWVWRTLQRDVVPALVADVRARGARAIRAWSAGCASGEEAHSLALLWHCELAVRWPGATLEVVATDTHDVVLDRARRGCYGDGSVANVPAAWREAAFAKGNGRDRWCLIPEVRALVTVACQDLRDGGPDGEFDLVFCRNLAFTYFDGAAQRAALRDLVGVLRPGGALVLGKHESLPAGHELQPWSDRDRIYRKPRLRLDGARDPEPEPGVTLGGRADHAGGGSAE